MLELPRASQWSKVFWRRKSTRYTASLLNIFITNFITVHDNFDQHLNFWDNRFEFLGETSWQGLKEQITTVFSLARFYTSNFSITSRINQHCHHGYIYLLRRAGRLNSLIWEHEQTSVRAAVRWKMKRTHLFLMFKGAGSFHIHRKIMKELCNLAVLGIRERPNLAQNLVTHWYW